MLHQQRHYTALMTEFGDYEKKPDYIAGMLEGNIDYDLREHGAKGVTVQATYEGKSKYLVVGMSGPLFDPAENNASSLRTILAQSVECPASHVAISNAGDKWLFAIHLTKETQE